MHLEVFASCMKWRKIVKLANVISNIISHFGEDIMNPRVSPDIAPALRFILRLIIINPRPTTAIYTPCTWICPRLITNSSPSLVGLVYLFQAWNVPFAEMTFASDRMANEKVTVMGYRSNLTGNVQ